MNSGIIQSVSGPLVTATGLEDAKIRDICYVGEAKLVGEIIQILSLIHISEPTRREWLSRMPSSA